MPIRTEITVDQGLNNTALIWLLYCALGFLSSSNFIWSKLMLSPGKLFSPKSKTLVCTYILGSLGYVFVRTSFSQTVINITQLILGLAL